MSITIREARKRAGINQTELAAAASVSYRCIYRMEKGLPVLKAGFLQVCQALKLETCNVFGVTLVDRRAKARQQMLEESSRCDESIIEAL